NDDQKQINRHHGPLHALDGALVRRKPAANAFQRPIGNKRRGLRLRGHFATSTACGASRWKSSKNSYSPGSSVRNTMKDWLSGATTFSFLSCVLSNSIGV